MALDDLKEVIEKLQGMINVHGDYLSAYETRTRQVLIDPLLQTLGWDVSDPGTVQLEYKLREEKSGRADYGLMWDNKPIAVVEAKHLGKSLRDKETQQANTYANENGIPYIIVTDGDRWEMYEVFKPVPLEERRLMKFQLSQQPAHENALQALRIWKPNLASGSPKPAMGSVIDSLQPASDSPSSPPNEPQSPLNDPPKDSDLTPRRQLYLEYWTAHRKHLEQRNGVIKPVKPNKGHWIYFSPFHDTGFCLGASASVKYKWTRVRFIFKGKDAKPHFRLLRQGRVDIEKEIGAELDWAEKPDKKESDIKLTLPDADPQDGQDWDRQHQWLCEQLETFHKVFAPRIQALEKEQIS